jgi:branched-chain amino acid transport system permease protein
VVPLLSWVVPGAALLIAPLVISPYSLLVLQSALTLAIACLALNLLLGYAGLLSLGHAVYFGIGAYAGGFLFTFADLRSFELYLASGLLAAAVLAAVVGALCVRATHIHFTILTLAFTQVVQSLFVGGAAFKPFGDIGKGFFLIGDGGLYLPRFSIASREIAAEIFPMAFYYVIALCFVSTVGILWRVVNSPFGMALRGIRDSASRAEFIGIHVRWLRWKAFVLSGIFTGLAGALAGQVDRQVTPHQLDWLFSAELVVATMLGGTRHFFGPVAGALAVVGLKEAALRFPLYHGLMFGVLLIAVVLVSPGGLASIAIGILARLRPATRPAALSEPEP